MFFGWHHFGLLLVLVAGQDGVFTRRPRHRSRKDAARRGERALARKTRARTEETEKWSVAERALAHKMRADETKKWSVAMIHIPKTAGSSIAEALWAGRHHACASYTGNLSLCNCKDTRCRSVAKVAVVEAPHRMVKALLGPMRREWLWVSIIRRPEDWFYSAVGQWCAGRGAGRLPCQPGADVATLRKASWFDPNAGRDRQASGEEKDGVKYYFFGPNIQTHFLSSVFLEDAWIVGTLEHSLETVVEAIRGTALESPDQFALRHSNSAHWPSLASFKQRVPWPSVRRYFAVDEAFYEHVVEQEGSCIGHRAGHTALPASEGDWAMGVTWV